ncbi:MAG: hypothetical protein IJ253_07155 [Bacteroidaceae bacterium]|nr:hypothetical protein [Bacteroidaceae bacterium]
MKKIFKRLCMTTALYMAGHSVWALSQKDGVYQIGTDEDLVAFAELVNNGNANINAVLTADIDLSSMGDFAPIGYHRDGAAYTRQYQGTFDGQGHVIRNLNVNVGDGQEAGLFGRTYQATIKNLGIVNATIVNTANIRAGVFGGEINNSTVTNCYSAGEIIIETPHSQKGGISGEAAGSTLSNCYTTYTTLANSASKTNNCYMCVAATAPTGELCYKLNDGAGKPIFYQTIGTDDYPVLDNTHGIVYYTAERRCDGKIVGEGGYTNDINQIPAIPDHQYENDVCTICGKYNPDFLPQVDGFYQIGNSHDLAEFVRAVNQGNSGFNAVLTSDIDLSDVDNFTPIGLFSDNAKYKQICYSGIFDGQGHEISNLKVNLSDPYEGGFFSRINAGEVKNLGIVNAKIVSTAGIRVGVLAGEIASSKITNVYTVGEIVLETSNSQMCGISGEAAASTLTNCYTSYTTLTNSASSTNNCYLNAADIAATGELCYKLNDGAGKTIFYQTIGTDDYPVLDATHRIVYTTGERRCDGKVIGEGTYTNDESQLPTLPAHQFDEDDVCTICGKYNPDFLPHENDFYQIADADDLVLFAKAVNMGNILFNAVLTADIDLSDIENFTPIGLFSDDASYGQVTYGGIFDGQGHEISNLKVDLSEPFEAGLFSRINGGEVRNMGIVNAHIVSKANIRVGVLAGEAASCKVTNVYTVGEIVLETRHTQKGGIAGEASSSTLTNCYTTYTTLTNAANAINDCYVDVADTAPTGALCYLMNGDSFLHPTWFQTLGEDLHPVLDSTHGTVYKLGEEYADVHDDASFSAFKSAFLESEEKYCDEVIAEQALIDQYLERIKTMGDYVTMEEFAAAYAEFRAIRTILESSAAAYVALRAKADEILAYLAEYDDFSGLKRDQLEFYLNEYDEPGDLYPNGTIAYIMETHTMNEDEVKAEIGWMDALLAEAIATGFRPHSNVTTLLANPDFSEGWSGWSGTRGTSTSTPVCEDKNKVCDFYQTLTGLKNGVYELRVAGAFRPGNPYAEEGNITSTNYAAMLYANGIQNYVMGAIEDIQGEEGAVDGGNCYLTAAEGGQTDYFVYNEDNEFVGYAPAGKEGFKVAARAGRYQNRVLAKVTDGTLTVGFRVPGTGVANDCLHLGNIMLYYCGKLEEAGEELDATLECMTARAQTLIDYVASSGSDYAEYPNYSASLRSALQETIDDVSAATNEAEKYALVERFSDLFQQAYESKKMYVALMDNIEFVVGLSAVSGKILTKEENTVLLDLFEEYIQAYDGGTATEEMTGYDYLCSRLAFLPRKVDGVYQIGSAAALEFFREWVNGGEADADAVLTDDIDLSKVENFTPIGYHNDLTGVSNSYQGTFDGQGHVISNLSVRVEDGQEAGLFGRINTGCVKNLGIVNAKIVNAANIRAGVFAGNIVLSTVANCFSAGEIVIETPHSQKGGLSGEAAASTPTNCYTTYATLTNSTGPVNCYWNVVDIASTGELCYKLNSGAGETIYYQTLGMDAYPVLDASHSVVIKN